MKQELNTIDTTDIDQKAEEKIQKRKEYLEENTLLSEREAETYILREELGLTTREAANIMEISTGNVAGKLGNIRDKIEKSKELQKKAENTNQLKLKKKREQTQ